MWRVQSWKLGMGQTSLLSEAISFVIAIHLRERGGGLVTTRELTRIPPFWDWRFWDWRFWDWKNILWGP